MKKEHSNYTSNEFNEQLWLAVGKDVVKYNSIVKALDAEMDADRDSTCSNCDLHRKYRQ